MRRDPEYGPCFDLVEIDGLVSFHVHIIRGGVLQSRLDVVHGEHGGASEHPGLFVLFHRLYAGEEKIRAMGVDGGKRHARGVHHAGSRGQPRAGRGRPRGGAPCAPSALVVPRSLEGNAQIAFEVGVDVHDGGMDLHQFHGLVQILDDFFVVRHAIGSIAHQHGIDARVGHDAYGSDLYRALRCRGRGALFFPSQCRKPCSSKLLHGGRLLGHMRAGSTCAAHHHGAEYGGDPRYGDGLVHAAHGDIVGPGVLERKNAHDDLLGLVGFVGCCCGPYPVQVFRGT